MQTDYDKDTIQKGRRKVFTVKQKLELLLPDGKKDGELEVGDLVYVVQKINKGGKTNIRFKVMKFSETEKQGTIYSADKKYFSPYFNEESKSKIEGDSPVEKKNYKVPMLTALGGGLLGYLMAQRFNKSKMIFGIGGIAVGLGVGIFLIYNKKKKDES